MTLRTLLNAPTIAARVQGLADEIRAHHGEVPITVIAVLKGSWIFAADLVRALSPHDVTIEFLSVASYEGSESTGEVRLLHDVRRPLAGTHVLVVEDIVDTGLTLTFLTELLRARNPASLTVVTLLDKPSRRRVAFRPDFVGFEIPDLFVVGYGLDFDERYRHLPFVGVMEGT